MTQSAAFTIQQPRMKATVKAYMRLSFSTHRATIEQFGCVWIQNLAPNKEIGNLVGNKEIQKVCALERRVATENWQIYGSLCRKGGSRCGYFIVVLMNRVATRDGFIFSWIHRR